MKMVPELRQKKSNQLLNNHNIGHIVNGFTSFLMIFSKANALTYISYAFSAHGNILLVFLTIDRAILIRWPYRYQTLPSWIQILFLVASPSAAFSSILIGSLRDNGAKSTVALRIPLMRRALVLGISSFSLVLFLSNLVIWLVLQKQKRAIRLNEPSQATTNDRIGRVRRDIASFYVCFGCVITYIILWLPELTRQSMWFFQGANIEGIVKNISVVILSLNPTSDAFVLVFFNKELKHHLKRFFRRFRPRRVSDMQMNTIR